LQSPSDWNSSSFMFDIFMIPIPPSENLTTGEIGPILPYYGELLGEIGPENISLDYLDALSC